LDVMVRGQFTLLPHLCVRAAFLLPPVTDGGRVRFMGERLATSDVESPIGTLRLAATDDGVVRIELPAASGAGFRGWLVRNLPDADRVATLPVLKQLERELGLYFAGKLECFEVPLDLRGTEFQRDVWRALREIPYGETRSYGEIAAAVGRPRAYRAVGLANGANPVPLVVPCHRVIAAGGKLGGFGGGLDTSRMLLALEQSKLQTGRLL
jgi:methylated-DNA-[protein]-cysteine S-methyltransferase